MGGDFYPHLTAEETDSERLSNLLKITQPFSGGTRLSKAVCPVASYPKAHMSRAARVGRLTHHIHSSSYRKVKGVESRLVLDNRFVPEYREKINSSEG